MEEIPFCKQKRVLSHENFGILPIGAMGEFHSATVACFSQANTKSRVRMHNATHAHEMLMGVLITEKQKHQ